MTPDPQPPRRPDDELLVDGQEEVFSRTEVETGHIEHHALEEDAVQPGAGPSPPRETDVDPDTAMAENFRSAFNPRP